MSGFFGDDSWTGVFAVSDSEPLVAGFGLGDSAEVEVDDSVEESAVDGLDEDESARSRG
jgi:hypothetical protein